MTIRKPALGRPADSRVTAEFIASDPRFTGISPFDPAQDIDIVDEMNTALEGVGGNANFFTNTKTLELDTVDHPNDGTGLGGTLQTGGKIVRLGFVSIPTPVLAT